MMITMMSRFIFRFFFRPILCRKKATRRYVSREVACFLTTGCAGRTSDDVFQNGHHLTHSRNRERVLDVEWYLFILICKKKKKNMWWDRREEWLAFYVF